MPLATRDEVKNAEGISLGVTTWDDEIDALILSVTQRIRRYAGFPIDSEAFVEKHDGPPWPEIILNASPVLLITSVVESGATLAGTDYEAVGRRLIRLSAGYPIAWVRGSRNVTVSYSAGFSSVPADIQRAAVLQIRHELHLGKNPNEHLLAMPSKALAQGGSAAFVGVEGELLAGVRHTIDVRRSSVRL